VPDGRDDYFTIGILKTDTQSEHFARHNTQYHIHITHVCRIGCGYTYRPNYIVIFDIDSNNNKYK